MKNLLVNFSQYVVSSNNEGKSLGKSLLELVGNIKITSGH